YLLVCFVSQLSSPTRHLPPFPTRRSSDLLDGARRFAGEDQGELLATIAGRDARRPRHPTQNAGDIAQHLIARLVPPGVVEALEMVDVDDGEPDRAARAFGLIAHPQQVFIERLAVSQIG